jgi:hypothetical protein
MRLVGGPTRSKCDALAQEYGKTYPKIVAQLVDLFSRAEAVDKDASRISGSAPSGEHRRLRQVELVARGLDNFSRADPPITKAVQLPDWTNSETMVWGATAAALIGGSGCDEHDLQPTSR